MVVLFYAQSTMTVISGGMAAYELSSLISRLVSVDVKHHVYLLFDELPSLINRVVSVDVKHHVSLLFEESPSLLSRIVSADVKYHVS